MNGFTRHTTAHLRFDRAHLHPSFRQDGRRVLAAPALGKASKERTSSDLLGFASAAALSFSDRRALITIRPGQSKN